MYTLSIKEKKNYALTSEIQAEQSELKFVSLKVGIFFYIKKYPL